MAVIISNKSGSGSSITFKAPTVQTFTTSGTYTPPSTPSPLYVKATVVGAGGGGSGSGSSSGTAATDGTASQIIFSASVVLGAGGGIAGVWSGNIGGAGGTTIVGGTFTPITVMQGQTGSGPQFNSISASGLHGGAGGSTPLSGAGLPSFNAPGQSAVANTGSGGAGAATFATGGSYSGSGGGAGAFIEAYLPSNTYTVNVGIAGSGGGAGTSGQTGGNGADGIIIIEEFYQ